MFGGLKNSRTFASLSKGSTSENRGFGEVAEWSIAAVLKTVVLRGTRGSNPCLSAIKGVNQAIARFTPFLFLIIGLKVVVQTCIYKTGNAKVLKNI